MFGTWVSEYWEEKHTDEAEFMFWILFLGKKIMFAKTGCVQSVGKTYKLCSIY